MNVRFVIFSILSMILIPHNSLGQDVDFAMRKVIVVGDGPFEIKNEGGVIGFVVALQGRTVTFKPCVGETFSLDRERLVRTNSKCKDAPSPDQNPLVANCNDAGIDFDKAKWAEAVKGTEPIGTTFVSDGDNTAFVQTVNPEQMKTAVNEVAQLKDCGRYTIGYDTDGKASLSIIRSIEAIQLDDLQ